MAWRKAGELAECAECVTYHNGAIGLLHHTRHGKRGRAAAGRVDGHDHVVGVATVIVIELVAVDALTGTLQQRVDVRRVVGLVCRVRAHAHRLAE